MAIKPSVISPRNNHFVELVSTLHFYALYSKYTGIAGITITLDNGLVSFI